MSEYDASRLDLQDYVEFRKQRERKRRTDDVMEVMFYLAIGYFLIALVANLN